MNEQKIKSSDFSDGVSLFVEILKAQPDNHLKLDIGPEKMSEKLAQAATDFAVKFCSLKRQHCGG